ncbi:MAG: endo-1,4-beta-xylanase [Alphaproteobacteria bacterium]|nr:endo-1,4-beta-xylanase [Alphaproteobacteria bacterium]
MASRRNVLKAGARSAASMVPLMLGLPACGQTVACEGPVEAASDRPLRAQAEDRGLLFGVAADRGALEGDLSYAQSIAAECSLLTPENDMKWQALRPKPDSFAFDDADWLVTFAEENGLRVHGHTLAWHYQLPDWFETTVDSANASSFLRDHIETVVGRYAGRVRSWDVVNEAIEPQDGRDDGLRRTPWLQRLGPDYIDLAYHAAAEADPDAVLVYNDYDIEYEGGYFEDRRRHLLDLLTGMVERGVPIHALGVQSHLRGHHQPEFDSFIAFLAEVADLGLDLMVTELDVRDHELAADVAERDCGVAATYQAYLDAVLDQPRLRSLAVWGLSDRYSWLSEFEPRDDGLPVRPLPLDREMKRKPAWNAISKALAG